MAEVSKNPNNDWVDTEGCPPMSKASAVSQGEASSAQRVPLHSTVTICQPWRLSCQLRNPCLACSIHRQPFLCSTIAADARPVTMQVRRGLRPRDQRRGTNLPAAGRLRGQQRAGGPAVRQPRPPPLQCQHCAGGGSAAGAAPGDARQAVMTAALLSLGMVCKCSAGCSWQTHIARLFEQIQRAELPHRQH